MSFLLLEKVRNVRFVRNLNSCLGKPHIVTKFKKLLDTLKSMFHEILYGKRKTKRFVFIKSWKKGFKKMHLFAEEEIQFLILL